MKKSYSGTPHENVSIFLDTFHTQVALAGLDTESALLLLPTCLEDRARRWYQAEKDANGLFPSLDALVKALKSKFTPTRAEKRAHTHKLRQTKQADNESVLDFNVRFEALAAKCDLPDEDVRDAYVDALRTQIREAIAIKCPDTHAEAMRDAMSLDISLARLAPKRGQAQVNSVSMDKKGKPYPVRKPCEKCGGAHSTKRCGQKCEECGKLGHLAHECRSKQECTHCQKKGHTADRCFKNPASSSYRAPKKQGN